MSHLNPTQSALVHAELVVDQRGPKSPTNHHNLPHSCRKACVSCGCSAADHPAGGDVEDDQRMGRLLADSPCGHLTAKVKGGGGLRVYKRNRMIVTNPVVSRKDPTFNTTTYEWAPAGAAQTLVRTRVA